jgi:hypothetical protein
MKCGIEDSIGFSPVPDLRQGHNPTAFAIPRQREQGPLEDMRRREREGRVPRWLREQVS